MGANDTSIRAKESTVERLYELKGRKESYDELLNRLLDAYTESAAPAVEKSPAPGDDIPPEPVEDPASHTPEELLREEGQFAGSGAMLDGRIAAILEMYDHLQSNPGEYVHKTALRDGLSEEALKATGYEHRKSLWSNAVKAKNEKPNALTLLPGVEANGNGKYRYVPEE